jgi:hypothetical protein
VSAQATRFDRPSPASQRGFFASCVALLDAVANEVEADQPNAGGSLQPPPLRSALYLWP